MSISLKTPPLILVLVWFRRILDNEKVYSDEGYNYEVITTMMIKFYFVVGTMPSALHALSHEVVPITQVLCWQLQKSEVHRVKSLTWVTQLGNQAEIQTQIRLILRP